MHLAGGKRRQKKYPVNLKIDQEELFSLRIRKHKDQKIKKVLLACWIILNDIFLCVIGVSEEEREESRIDFEEIMATFFKTW